MKKTIYLSIIVLLFTTLHTFGLELVRANESIQQIFEQRSFTVPTKGNANELAKKQFRNARSRYYPTGIYAAPNEAIIINVTDDTQLEAYINDFQASTWRNWHKNEFKLKKGTNTISAPEGGVVYLANENGSNSADVTIKGGSHIPVFQKGHHNEKDFTNMLDKYSTAPFVEFISEHAIISVTYASAKEHTKNPTKLLEKLDEAIKIENKVAGYDEASSNSVHSLDTHYHHLIELVNDPTYYMYGTDYHTAYRTGDAVAFILNADKFTTDGWGPWHEIGHTQQQSVWNFTGMTEVQVNIFSLAVQKEFGNTSSLEKEKVYDRMFDYLNLPSDNKDYDSLQYNNDSDYFGKLVMLQQLRLGLGDNFYPNLHRAYRELKQSDIPNTEEEKKQLFMYMASKVSGKDLGSFFDKWGLKINSETTKNIVNLNLPKLEKEIWLSTDTNPIKEPNTNTESLDNPAVDGSSNDKSDVDESNKDESNKDESNKDESNKDESNKDESNIKVGLKLAKNNVQVSIDKASQESNNRIIVYVNGEYKAESYDGVAYYSRINKKDSKTNIITISGLRLKNKDLVEVYVTKGKPGDDLHKDSAKLLKKAHYKRR